VFVEFFGLTQPLLQLFDQLRDFNVGGAMNRCGNLEDVFHRGYILYQNLAEVNSFLIAAHILTNLIVSQQFDLFCVIWNEDVKHHIIFNPKVAEK
jgi:hypothetical protein